MREDWTPCVYILASRRKGTLYLGVTTNLARRVWEHKIGIGSSFARKYSVALLVWYETFEEISLAIAREKAMKTWRRAWKIKRTAAVNPDWHDLYETLA